MKTLPSNTAIVDARKLLIIAMCADDPELMRWLKGFVKVYGEKNSQSLNRI